MRNRFAGLTTVIACALMLVVVGTACGSSSGRASTQPGRTAGTAAFSDLPGYHGATSVAAPTVNGGTTTQTFTIDGASPQEILTYYAQKLGKRWTVEEQPHALTNGSQSAWRGQWKDGGSTLIVSAEQTPNPNQGTTQYSLDLRTS